MRIISISICVCCFFLFTGCEKEKNIADELEGTWLYERETYNSFSSFEDLDTQGNMTFQSDETGKWISAFGVVNYDIEWDLQANDQKLAITKYSSILDQLPPITTIYDIYKVDDDNITLTYHFYRESPIDSIQPFEQFENIILWRKE